MSTVFRWSSCTEEHFFFRASLRSFRASSMSSRGQTLSSSMPKKVLL